MLEYVGPRWRTFVANMSIAIFFTIAACILPWIALYVADWQLLTLVTSAPLCLALLTPWLVPESARWLVSRGKIDKALGILKSFEKINHAEVKPEIYDQFKKSCTQLQKEEAANSNYSILDLFKTPRLRRITLLFIVIWMAISLAFDGHVRNVGALGLDVFVTFTVAAATEMPADVMLTFTLDIIGRRWYAFGSLVLSGCFSLLSTMFPIGIYSAIMAIIGRFWINISYNIGLQYVAEVLPTVVRAQGVTFVHIMGYVSSIVAPFVVYLSYIHITLPLVILGLISIGSGILCLFLPETLNEELPQTLDDGEQFGRNQHFWDIPCFKRFLFQKELFSFLFIPQDILNVSFTHLFQTIPTTETIKMKSIRVTLNGPHQESSPLDHLCVLLHVVNLDRIYFIVRLASDDQQKQLNSHLSRNNKPTKIDLHTSNLLFFNK